MKSVWVLTTLLFLTVVARDHEGKQEIPNLDEDKTSRTEAANGLHPLARVKRAACGGNLDSSTGLITSPSYPEPYSANTFCRWNISVAPTEQIELSFQSLDIEECTNCTCDYVKTYSRCNDKLIWGGTPYCGTKLPRNITSYENHRVIDFKTDHSVQKRGFSVKYTKKPCGSVFSSTYGSIESPRHPYNYPRNKRCTYEVIASPQHCIILNFRDFDLKYTDDCSGDSLQIYSTMHNGTVKNYGKSCGRRTPTSITCEGPRVRMVFTTDSHGEQTGFYAKYRQVYAECSVNNGGCRHICNSDDKGKHTCTCRAGFLLHPDDHDCKEENSDGRIVHLTSLPNHNGSLVFSWKWRDGVIPNKLSGFYFKATSAGHTFEDNLQSTLNYFTADQLHVYTEYEVRLWPFYGQKGASSEKLGKPVALSVRTPPSAPAAPTAVTPRPQNNKQRNGEVSLYINGPRAWNSKKVGFRVRWKPSDVDEWMERTITFTEYEVKANRNFANIQLSVKPGRTYTVSVRACGLGDLQEALVGPETTATFATIPLDPVDVRAEIIDPTSALLAWKSASPATRYEITVNMENSSQGSNARGMIATPILHSQVSSTPALWTRSNNMGNATISLNGNNLTSSNYYVPLFGLMPYRNYKMHIRSCADNACSEQRFIEFRTSPSSIPNATITKILSNDTSSIHLEWTFPRPEELVDLGLQFEVRVSNNGVFRIITTEKLTLTLNNLSSGTDYVVEVRPSLKIVPGRRKYGSAATAVVSTWPLVPLPPTLSISGFENAAGVVAVSWIFVNSTVGYVEVATNSSDFTKCETSASCDLVVLSGWNSSSKAGFIKLSNLSPHETHIVDVRGCNNHGCGSPTRVCVTTGLTEPSEPLDLHLETEGNMRALLSWKPPGQPGGPVAGYLVSWECGNSSTIAATTSECFFIIYGMPTHPQECSFSVSAYHEGNNGAELRGKPATLATQWPRG